MEGLNANEDVIISQSRVDNKVPKRQAVKSIASYVAQAKYIVTMIYKGDIRLGHSAGGCKAIQNELDHSGE